MGIYFHIVLPFIDYVVELPGFGSVKDYLMDLMGQMLEEILSAFLVFHFHPTPSFRNKKLTFLHKYGNCPFAPLCALLWGSSNENAIFSPSYCNDQFLRLWRI